MVLSRVLERKVTGQKSVSGSDYVFWKCKDEKVCIDLGGRGLG